MPEQIAFIGRKNELDKISALIAVWGKRQVACIHGVGGIGKTRLLQEIYTRYASSPKIQITKILDFDDQSLMNPESISQKIAECLAPKTFEPFLRAQLDYHRMQLAGVSPERLKQEQVAVNNSFAECFNVVAHDKKIVLLLDTTDHLEEGKGVWQDLGIKIPQLQNVTIVMAGRNARQIGNSFQEIVAGDVEIIELQPLSAHDSQLYLQQRQRQRHITIEPELAEKLLLLAGGRPILIDLAVEWRAHGIQLDWLIKEKPEEIKKLSAETLKVRQEEFERQLVSHLAQTREDRDDLILLMSRIYPLDVTMIADLIDLPEEKARALFEEVAHYVFVKLLPDGRIALHDEMRRIVNAYLWEKVDLQGDRRQRESNLAAQCLEHRIQTLAKQIAQLKENEKTAEAKKDSKAVLDVFTAREALIREIWVLKEQYLYHVLYVDVEKGIVTFTRLFDEATRECRFSSRESLLAQVLRIEKLSFDQRYEVEHRRVRHLIDSGKYADAKEFAEKIVNHPDAKPEQRVELLILIGNCDIRLGHHQDAIKIFQEAVQICQDFKFEEQNKLQEYVMRARNELGWGYRNVGNYEQAIQEYEKAHELSILLKSKKNEAPILNNLAFAYHRIGNHDGASKLADLAEKLWKELDDKRGMGRLYHVRARISLAYDNPTEGIEFLNRALEIFDKQGDLDWVHRLYMERGRMYWKRANSKVLDGELATGEDDLKLAETDLLKARSMAAGQYKISALHYLGEIYLTRDHINPGQYIEKSRKYFEQSYEECKEAAMNFMQLNSFSELALIAVEQEEYDRLSYFEKEYHDYLEKWASIAEPESTDGQLLKSLGDLALGTMPPQLDKALQYYNHGLRLIAIYEFDRTFGLEVRLKDIDQRLQRSEQFKNMRVELGGKLAELWKKNSKLNIMHPEARRFFTCWQQGKSLYD